MSDAFPSLCVRLVSCVALELHEIPRYVAVLVFFTSVPSSKRTLVEVVSD